MQSKHQRSSTSSLLYWAVPRIGKILVHSSSLVQPARFNKSIDLLPCKLLVVLFLDLIKGNDLLSTIDDGFYINIAFCEPVGKLLDLCSRHPSWLLISILRLTSGAQSCMCRTRDITS